MFNINNICKVFSISVNLSNCKIDNDTSLSSEYSDQPVLGSMSNMKRPFINIIVTPFDIQHYSDGSYINFLLHLYTKVLLNAGMIANPRFVNDILLPNSQFLDAYLHYSCWTLGHLIIKNLIIKYNYDSLQGTVLLDLKKLNQIQMISPDDININNREKINLDVIACISQFDLYKLVSKMNSMILNYEYIEFYEHIYDNRRALMLDISDFNQDIYKYNSINNSQLQKQVKKYIKTNSQYKEEKRYQLYKKKLLYIAVEHIPDIVKIDCTEDLYINYIEYYIENATHSQELHEKLNKIKSSLQRQY